MGSRALPMEGILEVTFVSLDGNWVSAIDQNCNIKAQGRTGLAT